MGPQHPWRLLGVAFFLFAGGCNPYSHVAPVTLYHPQTGAAVRCGPYAYAPSTAMLTVLRTERQHCIARYEEQGYRRSGMTDGKAPEDMERP